MKTMIKGKDAPLEETISKLKSKLQELGHEVEEVSWLNPVPNVWSVHIRDTYCPYLFTNGKGMTKEAALASALGEFFERLNCNYFFADFYLGKKVSEAEFVHYPNEKWFPSTDDKIPTGLMNKKLWSFYDPGNELTYSKLIDTNSGHHARGICALPYTHAITKEKTYIPVNIIGNLYVSNGMSAGNTQSEARVQALSEIFERHVKNTILETGVTLPDIPKHVLEKYPKVMEAIEKLESHGHPIICKDASLGGKFPVMNVTLLNPREGTAFASFGAHPKFQVALERTLTELLQGRSLDKLNVFSPPSFELEQVADQLNLEAHFIDSNGLIHWNFFKKTPDYSFVEWNFGHDSTQSEYEAMLELFTKLEKDVWIMDFNHLGLYGCRIHVPGVSEIYSPSDLVWENNNLGLKIRDKVLTLHDLPASELSLLYEQLEEGEFEDMTLVSHVIGIIPDPGTFWASLRVGELKAMISLAIKDYDLACSSVEWCLHFSPLQQERKTLYQCLKTLLTIEIQDEMNEDEFTPNVLKMYGEELVEKCHQLISGHQKFDGLHESDLNLKGFEMHQKLLASYEKLQKAKSDQRHTFLS